MKMLRPGPRRTLCAVRARLPCLGSGSSEPRGADLAPQDHPAVSPATLSAPCAIGLSQSPRVCHPPDPHRDRCREPTEHTPSSLRITCPSHLSGCAPVATSGYVSPEAEGQREAGRQKKQRDLGKAGQGSGPLPDGPSWSSPS